jgi:hypothetical protein
MEVFPSLVRRGIKRIKATVGAIGTIEQLAAIVQDFESLEIDSSSPSKQLYFGADHILTPVFANSLPVLTSLDLALFSPRITDILVKCIVTAAPNIEALELSYSHISDKGLQLIVQSLGKLHSLNLDHCNCITDEGVAQLTRSESVVVGTLKELGLSECACITGHIPFIGLQGLTFLDLSHCPEVNDYGLKWIARNMPALRRLFLRLCASITDAGVAKLAGDGSIITSTLEELVLWGCRSISGTALRLIGTGLKALHILDVGDCLLSDDGFNHLSRIPLLKELHAYRCRLESGVGLGLATIASLEKLVLRRSFFVRNETLKDISTGLQKLISLDISYCDVTDSGLQYVTHMPALQELCLRGVCDVTDAGMIHLGSAHLTLLDVSSSNVGDLGLEHFARSPAAAELRNLQLYACEITDAGLGHLTSSVTELRYLNIGRCEQVTDQGLKMIANHLQLLEWIKVHRGTCSVTEDGLNKLRQLAHFKKLVITDDEDEFGDMCDYDDDGDLGYSDDDFDESYPSDSDYEYSGPEYDDVGWCSDDDF